VVARSAEQFPPIADGNEGARKRAGGCVIVDVKQLMSKILSKLYSLGF
jgi:hypothetical protein